MPIKMNCPSCNTLLSAPETAAGKRAKCLECGQIMIVPEVVQEAEDIYAPVPGPSSPFSPPPSADATGNWLDEMHGSGSRRGPLGAGDEARRPCPECGSMIPVGAAKCRFCNAIFDSRLKVIAPKKKGSPDDATLSVGEWILCIIFSIIGCIVGIVFAIQGKPKGMKMVGIAVVSEIVKDVIYGVYLASQQAPPHFR